MSSSYVDPDYYDQDYYFTVTYILVGVIFVSQIFFFTYVMWSHRSIMKILVERGRLLQIFPLISIATVNMQQPLPNTSFQVMATDGSMSTMSSPPAYPGNSGAPVVETKEVPPPYAP